MIWTLKTYISGMLMLQYLYLSLVRPRDQRITDLKRYMILLLLARCGLRTSEPLRLSVDDYCREEGTIHIRKTKFKKSRIIPLPRSLVTAMDGYLSVRKQLGPNGPILFPGERCKNVSAQIVRSFFNRSLGPHHPRSRGRTKSSNCKDSKYCKNTRV